jgi:hypothetical protein
VPAKAASGSVPARLNSPGNSSVEAGQACSSVGSAGYNSDGDRLVCTEPRRGGQARWQWSGRDWEHRDWDDDQDWNDDHNYDDRSGDDDGDYDDRNWDDDDWD